MPEFSNSFLSFLAKSTAPGVSPWRHIVSASYVIVLPSIASTLPSVIILILLSTTSSTSCITELGFDLETSVPSGSTALSANTSFPILSPISLAVQPILILIIQLILILDLHLILHRILP